MDMVVAMLIALLEFASFPYSIFSFPFAENIFAPYCFLGRSTTVHGPRGMLLAHFYPSFLIFRILQRFPSALF
jgi:hypothetical protein